MKKLQRCYRLLLLIRTRDVESKQLANELDCSISQVEKDIAYLREIGVHIEHRKSDAAYFSKTRLTELTDLFVREIQND